MDEHKKPGRPRKIDEAVVENPISDSVVVIENHPALLSGENYREQSPIEQKIHNLIDAQPPAGWGLTENAPKDGNRIVLSDNGLDHGVAAYWRNTRKVDKAKLRYVPTGRWTDILTGAEINPVPRFFKPYSAEEYFPLNAPVQKTGIVG